MRQTFDHRKAPWLPSTNRMAAFDRFCELARQGLSSPQIAAQLGTTDNAFRCYRRRYGITMAELRGEDVPGQGPPPVEAR